MYKICVLLSIIFTGLAAVHANTIYIVGSDIEDKASIWTAPLSIPLVTEKTSL